MAVDETEEPAELRRSHEALQELYLVTSEPGLSETERIERMLDIGRRRLGVESAHLSVIDPANDDYEVELAAGDGPVEAGMSVPFSMTHCAETTQHDEPQLYPNLDEVVWDETLSPEAQGLSCYAGGRVDVDGELYGTVCFSGVEPREPFTDDERTLVGLLVEWIGGRLQQRQLAETVANQRAAIEAANSAITIAEPGDGERPLVYANRGFETLTGYDRDAVVGRDCEFLQGAETDPETAAGIGRTLAAGEHVESVIRNYRADGTAFWNELEVTPIREDGEVVRFVGVQRDVTERVEQREAVEALLERTRALLAAESVDEVAETAATAVEEVLGHDCVVRLHDPDSGLLIPVAGRARDRAGLEPLAPGESISGTAFERGVTTAFGDAATAAGGYGAEGDPGDGLAVPLGEHGTLAVAPKSGVVSDFDRRIAEILAETVHAALDDASQRDRLRLYETAMEEGSEMTAVIGADGRVELVSDSLARFLDTDREALVGRQYESVVTDADAASISAAVEAVEPGESSRFETTITADGESRPVEVDVSLGEGPDPVVVAVVHDIQELAATRGALSEQRDRFSSLFAHLPDPVLEATFEDGVPVIRRCNRAFAATFAGGRSPEELVGERTHDVVGLPRNDDGSGRRTADAKLASGERVTLELTRRTDAGPREFLFRGVPYLADGERRLFGIYTDVTDRKRRQQRVEVLNRVLRHNVRNQLGVAQGHAELLAEAAESDTEQRAAEGLLEATGNLLEVSEKARAAERALSGGRPDGASVDTVVHETLSEVRAAWPDRIVTSALPDDLPAVERAERLGPVLLNLVENGLEHTDSSVHVELARSDDRLELRVSDDGPGVPGLERELVADERRITQLDHGNGIGLRVVRWIVDAMGGDVRFEDGDGHHTVVVSVPVADR
jgi:PAS domain S-box-containing protein